MTSGKMIESGIGGFILQKLGKGGGRVQMGNFQPHPVFQACFRQSICPKKQCWQSGLRHYNFLD